ncbi:Sodium/glutamate symport carrier protein [Symmachiella macrocystis]|uniref:Sodium/glutamate symporter n=1 Tax=Symmachiella macrocystis TaxID=2527985 RepID=A0A5C6BKF1_9PLAN|nr:sodium/glutamate symporter [Symmachiella macrocystis]TWU12465.1 Sodium/glutamate symport carrier protein [Symmachiella macrocystis]
MDEPIIVNLDSSWTIIVAVIVLYAGRFATSHIRFLREFNIPEAVSGGILCSVVVAIVFSMSNHQITFDLTLRDTLLLVFFSTIGLSAKFRTLLAGGKALALLVVCSIGFLILQDVAGIAVAMSFGQHPAYGLISGSIAFAGGHGSAISYGQLAAEQGLPGALELGMASATFGLIAGGLIGGPIARRLMSGHNLSGEIKNQAFVPGPDETSDPGPVTLNGMLDSIFALAICIAAGAAVNEWYTQRSEIPLPGFLTAMFVGIVITNCLDVLKIDLHKASISLCSDVSLQLFLAMSLMSLQLWSLQGAFGYLLIILLTQIAVMVLFALYVVFPAMGRDYDAAVIAAGFSGLGLGATPVGIANMHAVTEKYGASQKAFLVVPLVGAFFLDIANAVIIQGFLATPLFRNAAG